MKPVVAIVGRPNVGKSTLFNRLCGERHAIVEDSPGVTRDRLYREAEWQGYNFTIIDTGGVDFMEKEDIFINKVIEQANLAIEEADVIIMVADGKGGMVSQDLELAERLRRAGKPVVLAVNKIDNYDNSYERLYDFYALGLGEPIAVSSMHGTNTGDLLDAVVAYFPERKDGDSADADILSIAVVGRPNVGKSSLVNRLLGEERSIVTNIPGTTRDAIDTYFKYNGEKYKIVDTAGMRRRARIAEPTERYSVARSLQAVDRSDVVLVVLNAAEGILEQDKKIAGYAEEQGKGIVLVINKWDLPAKDSRTLQKFADDIKEELSFIDYVPQCYVSALTGQRVGQIMEQVNAVAEENSRRLPAGRLNEVVMEATLLNPPPSDKGKRLKIFYATQVGIKPPTFVFFVNDEELMHFSYLRYLENQLRQNFSFTGTPLRLKVRGRSAKSAAKEGL